MNKENISGTKKIYCFDELWAFVLCSIAMFLVCFLSEEQYAFNSTLVTGDTLEQYVPAVRSFFRNILAGERIDFSWDLFMGMNATAYYSFYVGGSVVNLIWLLFPGITEESFLLWALILKAGLAGAFFTLYVKKVLGAMREFSVMFSVFYALCGFQMAINTMNYIWMDALYMLPLILYFLVEFIDRKKWIMLTLSYAYLFLCNFYMAYIVGFFSLLYLVLYILFMEKEKKILLKFVLTVILAAGLVAFMLLPSAYFILQNSMTGEVQTESVFVAPLKLICRFSFGIPFESNVKEPYFYCGVPVTILMIFYFADKKIKAKEKILYGCLLSIMLISCMVNPLYLFWHGFDVPDGWYYRFAFIVSFLGVSIGCKEVSVIFTKEQKRIKKVGKYFALTVFLCLLFACNCRVQNGKENILWLINMAISLGWIIYFAFYFMAREKAWKEWVTIGFALAFFEVIANGRLEYNQFEDKMPLQILDAEMQGAVGIVESDQGFYRVNVNNTPLINSDTHWGFMGISDFSSLENVELRKTLENLGAYTSPRVIKSDGLNSFTQLILGIKYDVIASGSNDYLEMGARVIPYEKVLQLGFLVDKEVLEFEFPGESVRENTNALASCMTGQNHEIFTEISSERITIEEGGIIQGQEEGWFYLQGQNDVDDVLQITYATPYEGQEAYAVFHARNKGIHQDSAQFYEPYSTIKNGNGHFGVVYSNPMDIWEDRLVCVIVMKLGITSDYASFINAEFFSTNQKDLSDFYNIVNKHQLMVESYKNGYVKGNITIPDTQQILFTSIPFDEGWSVEANGKRIKTVPLLQGAFLGVIFEEPGEYELEFSYKAMGLDFGIWISVISWIIYIICIYRDRKKN